MDELKKRLIQLVHCKRLGWKAIYSLLKANPSLRDLYSPLNDEIVQSNLPSMLNAIPIDDLLEDYFTSKVKMISIFDEGYPPLLKTIYQPPWILFVKGDSNLLNSSFSLAVVGSREATPYGRNVIEYLFPELIHRGAMIISGLARGIDAHAHEIAMKNGGKTLAVIAGGFNHIYPRENCSLAHRMMRDQAIISEYPPIFRPEKWQFPLRNRIISGLAKGTLVIEAKKRSGSFITADYALNEGREVFAIPGSILSPSYCGTNELIQLGAKLVKEPKDIIEEILI
ncbi:DNA-processing protein DprA [Bacillus sp. B15-48]|uniref:DNA-processing protein DprA n=1 Tax=Bacillus sp. B15-48 TaxID=1548601 RepID=UPI00193F1271|nr:DNA-processing protein DprA [Bacillus sp. B15-48]MBM4763946.1 DNA-protecting protein DprA [Bacillus sp. B15-48]